MNRCEVIAKIESLVNECRQQNELEPIPVEDDTQILGGSLGIDSLDLAALVVRLEEATGRDPFAAGIINFRTVSELAALYTEGEA